MDVMMAATFQAAAQAARHRRDERARGRRVTVFLWLARAMSQLSEKRRFRRAMSGAGSEDRAQKGWS